MEEIDSCTSCIVDRTAVPPCLTDSASRCTSSETGALERRAERVARLARTRDDHGAQHSKSISYLEFTFSMSAFAALCEEQRRGMATTSYPAGLLETALVQYLRCMFGALHSEQLPNRCDA